jgi:hypothetical protein
VKLRTPTGKIGPTWKRKERVNAGAFELANTKQYGKRNWEGEGDVNDDLKFLEQKKKHSGVFKGQFSKVEENTENVDTGSGLARAATQLRPPP